MFPWLAAERIPEARVMKQLLSITIPSLEPGRESKEEENLGFLSKPMAGIAVFLRRCLCIKGPEKSAKLNKSHLLLQTSQFYNIN